MDAWVCRLKAAYEGGYYQTEREEGAQTPFPWQNKTCKDCPFWANSVCQVHAESRGPLAHTCISFDAGNRSAAQSIIQERQAQGFQRWWHWFNDRGAAPYPVLMLFTVIASGNHFLLDAAGGLAAVVLAGLITLALEPGHRHLGLIRESRLPVGRQGLQRRPRIARAGARLPRKGGEMARVE